MNYNSETINKLYYGDRLINISVTNSSDAPSNLSEWTYDDDGNLKTITYTAETIPASTYSYSKLTNVTIKNSVKNIGNYAFSYCSSLTSIDLPNSVTSIGNSTFRDCTRLTSVAIPNCVTSIGSQAFASCSRLTSVTIPNNVTSIDDSAFQYCSGLMSATIGSGVTSIGKKVFQYCSKLTSITINATTPPALSNSNSFDSTNNCPIYVPAASVDAYKAAANWSTYASRIQAIP